jgi:hypothetical protein
VFGVPLSVPPSARSFRRLVPSTRSLFFFEIRAFYLPYTSILHNPSMLLETDHQNTPGVAKNAHLARFSSFK